MEDVEKIIKQATETQEFLNSLESYVEKSLLIEGKTIPQWKKQLYVHIPEDLNFAGIIKIASKLSINYQLASRYRDSQGVQLSILEQTKNDKYNENYQYAQDESRRIYGKNLAAESCKISATLAVKDLEEAIKQQKLIYDFWAKTCASLSEIRKILELAGYALSGDSRIQKDFIIKEHKE